MKSALGDFYQKRGIWLKYVALPKQPLNGKLESRTQTQKNRISLLPRDKQRYMLPD